MYNGGSAVNWLSSVSVQSRLSSLSVRLEQHRSHVESTTSYPSDVITCTSPTETGAKRFIMTETISVKILSCFSFVSVFCVLVFLLFVSISFFFWIKRYECVVYWGRFSFRRSFIKSDCENVASRMIYSEFMFKFVSYCFCGK